MKTIGVVGSRRRDSYEDYLVCKREFDKHFIPGVDRIVSGGCPQGGDRFAELFAHRYGLTEENGGLIIHRADWKTYGKRAGFLRNTDIAKDADIVIAVVAPDRKGGTEDTIRKATHFGKPVFIV